MKKTWKHASLYLNSLLAIYINKLFSEIHLEAGFAAKLSCTFPFPENSTFNFHQEATLQTKTWNHGSICDVPIQYSQQEAIPRNELEACLCFSSPIEFIFPEKTDTL